MGITFSKQRAGGRAEGKIESKAESKAEAGHPAPRQQAGGHPPVGALQRMHGRSLPAAPTGKFTRWKVVSLPANQAGLPSLQDPPQDPGPQAHQAESAKSLGSLLEFRRNACAASFESKNRETDQEESASTHRLLELENTATRRNLDCLTLLAQAAGRVGPASVRESSAPPAGFGGGTPEQAAEWIHARATELGGAAMDDDCLQVLRSDIGAAAGTLDATHLQAMGRALGRVFNPVPSSSSSSSSLSAALAGPVGYEGLKRLLHALLAGPSTPLSPAQAGAFVQGMRLTLRPRLAGADAVFCRAIAEAFQVLTPHDTIIGMTCGWVSASLDPAADAQAYRPVKLPPGFNQPQMQAAMNLGKRLALNPASLFGADVKASRDKRFEWMMIAYRMPKPQANEYRLPPASRNYIRQVFRVLAPHQKLELLTAYNQTRHLGPLRDAKAEAKAETKAESKKGKAS